MDRREFLRDVTLALPLIGGAACTDTEPASGPGVAAAGGEPDAQASLVDLGAGVPFRENWAAGWRFIRDREELAVDPGFDDGSWELVTLPHTARVEAVVTGAPGSPTYQWQGTAWYRRRFTLPAEAAGRRVFLRFEGAMNVAEVWLDGAPLGKHLGGYLPFGFDISERAAAPGEHVLAVRLDNRDDAITGPKPLRELDFNLFGGLYREVWLEVKARLFITDPILEGAAASGGLLVTYPSVSSTEAVVAVQVHVRNADVAARQFVVRLTLRPASGEAVASATSPLQTLAPGSAANVAQNLVLAQPALWTPRQPNLYELRAEVVDAEHVVDAAVSRVGVRRLEMTGEGLRINGELTFLRGTNRHQEYPYIGYALSPAAQYRDAKRIKEAGFDYVRLSHYPQHPAFLDACDELGIALMNCIPGWQYFNADPAFAELQYDNCRRLIRRDRNHPSVILWEVSLNETEMSADFIARTHAIAHEEYPDDQCFTCGWRDGYDVFIQARQHGGCRGIVGRPCVVSEYGDWEYYAQNAGLNQQGWADLAPDDRTSRQLRWNGEAALLQQVRNFQEAHGGNRQTIAFADGLWVMFDYNRGYAPDIESSGCMDIFRLPKFWYHFFRSQRDAAESYAASAAGPMLFIASYWTASSSLAVRVFSNAEQVELQANGSLIERRSPDQDALSVAVAHPPFTFSIPSYAPGSLEAVAFIGGVEVARQLVRTPGPIRTLALWLDDAGKPLAADGKDAVIIHAELRDEVGTLVPDAWENVFFAATGAVALIGANPFSSDGGIASILLQADAAPERAAIYAMAFVQEGEALAVVAGALGVAGALAAFEVRVSTDGSAPQLASPLYTQPVTAAALKAALFVDGQKLIEADSSSERFRLLGSRAPT